jgi:hypothetical protein
MNTNDDAVESELDDPECTTSNNGKSKKIFHLFVKYSSAVVYLVYFQESQDKSIFRKMIK